MVLELVFALGWAAFWIYWFVAAFSMKRGRIAWGQQLRIRVLVFGVAVVAVRLGAFRDHAFDTDPWRASVGIALFGLGLGLAVWARRHLGRNWGTPMSQKKDPELVTTGPYRVVRHPIYTGMLAAGVGTATALGWWLLVAVALAATYFIYSATVEERWLVEQFPTAYVAYRRETKMLVPFIF